MRQRGRLENAMSNATVAPDAASLRAVAEQSNAWPFEEARKIVARLKQYPKDEVIFETGYGPSGLPHIGTFGEVARTTMVRHAFRVLTEDKMRTRLIAFSDDMDGLRKVPDNIPNKDMVAQHLGKPLTRVPDPFGTHPSFGAHNKARLGDALAGAWRRLRNGRQGPHRFGKALRRHLPCARWPPAGGVQLRIVPRRQGPEDFEVEGQWPHHRGMAALCEPGKPVVVHVP